jgi:hypothetical protein
MRAAPRPPSISLIGDALDTISIKTQRRWRRPRSGRYFAARHMMVPIAILSPPICTKGSPASSASGQRIFGALVQTAHTITAESLSPQQLPTGPPEEVREAVPRSQSGWRPRPGQAVHTRSGWRILRLAVSRPTSLTMGDSSASVL